MILEIVESLDDVLTLDSGSTSFKKWELPDELSETDFVEKELRPPTRCPFDDQCRVHCDWEREESELIVECDEGHQGRLPVEEYLFYDICFDEILKKIAEEVEKELESFDDGRSPEYVSGTTADGYNLYLIVSPSDYEKTVNEICMDTLTDDTPALLITPEKSVKELLEIKSLFSSSNLIYTTPFTMLSEPDVIQNSLETIERIQSVEQEILSEQRAGHPVVYRVNSNPRYILTELNHMRLLRIAGELPGSSGTRLEEIGESAFSHLFVTYPEAGGEDDRGQNLPDSVFYISPTILPDDLEPVLGVVDTKSGKDASFRSETIEGKHDNYISRARRQSVNANKIAHIFVILDFDGQQELDFYDEMSQEYEEGEYMVIITAEALALMMTAYLAHTVSNELKLVRGNFQTVIYPLFEKEAFIDSDLGGITREVGKNPEEYKEKYQQRSGLLIITEEVVEERIKQCVESPNDVEELLHSYFRPTPTV